MSETYSWNHLILFFSHPPLYSFPALIILSLSHLPSSHPSSFFFLLLSFPYSLCLFFPLILSSPSCHPLLPLTPIFSLPLSNYPLSHRPPPYFSSLFLLFLPLFLALILSFSPPSHTLSSAGTGIPIRVRLYHPSIWWLVISFLLPSCLGGSSNPGVQSLRGPVSTLL